MKLHVGCGANYLEGYVNLEYAEKFSKPPFKVDILADATDLPYDDDMFDEVLSFHVIEHMPRPRPEGTEQWRRSSLDFMKESYRVLKEGGIFIAECPDFEQTVREYVLGNKDRINNIYGLDRYPGDVHQWGFTRGAMFKMLTSVGFKEVAFTEPVDYHKDLEPCMRVEAIK